MKLALLLLLLTLPVSAHSQSDTLQIDTFQNANYSVMLDSITSTLNWSKIPTGILIDRSFPTFDISAFSGVIADTNFCSPNRAMMIYSRLFNSKPTFDSRLSPDSVAAKSGSYLKQDAIPVCLIDCDYQQLKLNSLVDSLVLVVSGKLVDNTDSNSTPLSDGRVYAASALKNYAFDSVVTFVFDSSSFFYTNRDLGQSVTEIDFDDGGGFRRVVWDSTYEVYFPEERLFEIIIRSNYGLDTSFSRFHFARLASMGPADSSTELLIETRRDGGKGGRALNATSRGTIHRFFGCPPQNQARGTRRPIIIVEGFDPLNDFELDHLTAAFNKAVFEPNVNARLSTLGRLLLDEGYDLIFLDFADGGASIHDNAQVLKAFIELINQEKLASGSDEENIVIGASMGGLIARYALAQMEQEEAEGGPDHETRLYISLDAPHKGANVPLSLQYFNRHIQHYVGGWASGIFGLVGNYLAGPLGAIHGAILGQEVVKGIPSVKALNSPAAKELMVFYVNEFQPMFAEVTATLERGRLQETFANLGYPERSRNVAVAMGSGNATDQGYGPNVKLLHAHMLALLVNYNYEFWGVPISGKEVIGSFITVILGIPGGSIVSSPTDPKGYDHAPGGWYEYLKTVDDAVLLAADLKEERQCFIPTVSALDMSDDDLFVNVSVSNPITPFDAVYFQDHNIKHVLGPEDGDGATTTAEERAFGELLFRLVRDEIAPADLFIQNRLYDDAPDFVDHRARRIRAGRNVTHLEPAGDVRVLASANVEMIALHREENDGSIWLTHGFRTAGGGRFHARVQVFPDCANTFTVAPPRASVKKNSKGRDQVRINPNPFTNSTSIEYDVAVSGRTTLEIYNSVGQKVEVLVDYAEMEAGTYRASFTARDLRSGVYYLLLANAGSSEWHRLVLVK